jgi:ABC-type amino acid transport substrate-binding protein
MDFSKRGIFRITAYLFAIMALTAISVSAVTATDLDEVRQRGVLRHLGIPYANFVTGTGDGMDVELTRMFAAYLGVRYEYVATDWGTVVQDLVGKKIKVKGSDVDFLDDAPVKGDMIANGFTVIPWREKAVNFSAPTFPSQIWLIARADSKVRPIKPTGAIEKDIEKTRNLLKEKNVMALEKTCLDPSLHNLVATGANVIRFKGKLNELAPAVINNDAEMTILDVPDALIALEKWPGKIKIIGPISNKQVMGAAFTKDAPKLLEAYNRFLKKAQKDGTYMKVVNAYYPSAKRYFPAFFKSLK